VPSNLLLLVLTLTIPLCLYGDPNAKPRRSVFWKCKMIIAGAVVATIPAMAGIEFVTTESDTAETVNYREEDKSDQLNVYVVGDSISAGNMAYASGFQTILRTRSREQAGWALDTNKKDNGLNSVFERLGEKYPTRMVNAAWSGAYVDEASPLDRTAANTAGQIRNFSDQMKRLKSAKEKPNLILLAPFHNNLDFFYDVQNVKDLDIAHKEKLDEAGYLKKIPDDIAAVYLKHLRGVIALQRPEDGKLAIVLFGNMNLKAAFEARAAAKELHAKDKKKYPYIDVADTNFPSVRPENQAKMIDLASRVNTAIEGVVATLNQEIKDAGRSDQIEVTYSDALSTSNLSAVENVHKDDGFHPSAIGHNGISESVYPTLAKPLKFLGFK